MAKTSSVFATQVYQAQMAAPDGLAKACLGIAQGDIAGQRWAKAHGYRGYTSYASLDDLPLRAPEFAELAAKIDPHVKAFARQLSFARTKLRLDSIWINVMAPGGVHGAHIHPHAAISGTYYVVLPRGASAIRFEDPRLPLMMAAPAKRESARDKPFLTIAPKAGTLLLWESWLRHDVPQTGGRGNRVSVSFNYS
jgi:uncharacterized protein (TIGR02466 family)